MAASRSVGWFLSAMQSGQEYFLRLFAAPWRATYTKPHQLPCSQSLQTNSLLSCEGLLCRPVHTWQHKATPPRPSTSVISTVTHLIEVSRASTAGNTRRSKRLVGACLCEAHALEVVPLVAQVALDHGRVHVVGLLADAEELVFVLHIHLLLGGHLLLLHGLGRAPAPAVRDRLPFLCGGRTRRGHVLLLLRGRLLILPVQPLLVLHSTFSSVRSLLNAGVLGSGAVQANPRKPGFSERDASTIDQTQERTIHQVGSVFWVSVLQCWRPVQRMQEG